MLNSIIDMATGEMTLLETSASQSINAETANGSGEKDVFWGSFDKDDSIDRVNAATSVEAEIWLWSGINPLSRHSNTICAVTSLKIDYPRIFKHVRKYSVFPATQNSDERLFSMVNRNAGALSQSIKIETVEQKVVVGSAIQRHGFVFHYKSGTVSSSDEDE